MIFQGFLAFIQKSFFFRNLKLAFSFFAKSFKVLGGVLSLAASNKGRCDSVTVFCFFLLFSYWILWANHFVVKICISFKSRNISKNSLSFPKTNVFWNQRHNSDLTISKHFASWIEFLGPFFGELFYSAGTDTCNKCKTPYRLAARYRWKIQRNFFRHVCWPSRADRNTPWLAE